MPLALANDQCHTSKSVLLGSFDASCVPFPSTYRWRP